MRAMLLIDKKTGETVKRFRSVQEASRRMQVSAGTLYECACLKTLLSGRFFIRFQDEWEGVELFTATKNRPIIAIKEDGKPLARWFPTARAMGEAIGTSQKVVTNAIRSGIRVHGWRAHYAASTAEWPLLTSPNARNIES